MAAKNRKTGIEKHHDRIVYGIGRLYCLLNQRLTDIYSEFGLNPAKFNLLMSIKHKGGEKGISQNELGKGLYVSAANITKLVDGLQEKGWVTRLPSSSDRRVNLIRISEQGSRLLDRVWPRHAEALNALLEGWSEEDKEGLSRFLAAFLEQMQGGV